MDIPAAVLGAILLLGLLVLYRAQRAENFDTADMLRDENGKPSALRLAIFVCLALSSWNLVYETMHSGDYDFGKYALYLLTWSGSALLAKAIEKWDGKFPQRQ